MKFLVNAAIALAIGVLSAALAVIYQSDIAGLLGRAPVTALVEVGPWSPIPASISEAGNAKLSEDQVAQYRRFSDKSHLNFARITVENNSGSKIDNVIVVFKSQDRSLDFVDADFLYTSDSGELKYIRESKRVEIGPIGPASSRVIYMWSIFAIGGKFGLDNLSIKTSLGDAPIKSVSHEVSNGYDGFSDNIDSMLYWFIVISLLILISIVFYALHLSTSFWRALLSSEDYYLEQKPLYDEAPKRFEPKTIPDELATQIRSKHA